MTGLCPLPATTAPATATFPLLLIGNFLNGTVRTLTAAEELACLLESAGYPVLTTSARMNRALRLADMLWTVWRRRHDYRLAHVSVFSGPAFRWAEAACALLRRLGKPYVLTLHGGNLPAFERSSGHRVKALLQSAAAVTAPSAYLQEQLRHCRSDIILLPNSIELRQYPFRLRRRARPKLIWLRAFHEIYNPMLAVSAVDILSSAFPEVELVMVGREKDGTLEATRRLIAQRGLGGRITIQAGVPKSEVPRQLASADIFLNTANTDNTPVTVIEAMACGLCVVSTSPGGIPYLLSHGNDSLLVPVGNAEALAAAVSQLVNDPALAERLSMAARRKVEPFDVATVTVSWKALLDSVMQRTHS
ncbi:MAG: glycosyltransferase [Bryobacterales bacterium]|nr:glycosyltransferase [Bryobacterales bacterium]